MGYSNNRGKNRGYNNQGSGNRFRDFSSFSRPSFGPKPVEVNKEYDMEITDVSRRGEGIGKVQGFIVFVPGTKAGQKVRVRIERVGNRFASGSVVGSNSKQADSSTESETSEESPLTESITDITSEAKTSNDVSEGKKTHDE